MLRHRPSIGTLVRAAATASLMLAVAGCGGDEPAATCDGGCALPPPAICDGDTRISFMPGGECVDGRCSFPPVLTDCAADGGSCEGGACVGPPPDPCDGVRCDEPDIEPTCDGDVVVRALVPGTCDSTDGTCSWDEDRIDCASFGEVCVEGECRRPGNPCFGITCEDPPRNACDGDIALRYDDSGACDPETLECVYDAEEVDCAASGAVCFRGQCIIPDPCDGVTCNRPPDSFCVGGELTEYPPAGRCVEGECVYSPMVGPCPDGTNCVDGACVEPDPCDGVVCNRPPPNICDGDTLVIYAGRGECTAGFCTYETSTRDCAADGFICDEGICFDAGPCHEVSCLDAPGAECDGNVAIEYSSPGTCAAGLCEYEEARTNCAATDGVCIDGECIDACTDVVCGERRDPECADEVTLLRRVGASECVAGECVWTATVETACDAFGAVCREGECIVPDPCEDVTCPAVDICRGAFRVVRDADGVCVEGDCDYGGTERLVGCGIDGQLCSDGECVPPGPLLAPDDIIFVEIMPLPMSDDPLDQWLELHNRTPNRLDLAGLTLVSSERGSWTLPGFIVEPFSSVGIGARVDISDEIEMAWGGTFALDGAADTLSIRYEGFTISSLSYDATTWPFETGVSAQLTAGALDGGDATNVTNWCAGSFPYNDDDLGSPGFRNAFCPF